MLKKWNQYLSIYRHPHTQRYLAYMYVGVNAVKIQVQINNFWSIQNFPESRGKRETLLYSLVYKVSISKSDVFIKQHR